MHNAFATLRDVDVFAEALRNHGWFVLDGNVCCGTCGLGSVRGDASPGQRYVLFSVQALQESFGDVSRLEGPSYVDGVIPVEEAIADDGQTIYRVLSDDEAGAVALMAAAARFSAVMQERLHLTFGINDDDAEDEQISTAANHVVRIARSLGLQAEWSGDLAQAIIIGPARSGTPESDVQVD